jgi:hypothetical protein
MERSANLFAPVLRGLGIALVYLAGAAENPTGNSIGVVVTTPDGPTPPLEMTIG